ncbi:MAG: DNA mismatch repair protein MutS [Bryobacterales bacterium]|nr:DNA mismatch repair protein MutS [Bryobacterales bacterium]
MSAEAATPLMRQYLAAKEQAPRALLFFRLGDFYELFYDDAVTAARELEITLTSRNKEKGEPVPMCGVPHHAAEGYIARLLQRNYRVAICEQMEAPGPGKKLVRREITRVVTPGTATEANVLRSRENNYLAAATLQGERAGLAWVDLSTGEFRTTETDATELAALIEQCGARELLVSEALRPVGDSLAGLRILLTDVEAWTHEPAYADQILRDHFRLLSLDGCGLAGKPLATGGAGALLHYLRETQKSALDHLEVPTFLDRGADLVLDAVTIHNLELFEPIFSQDLDGNRQATLIATIDRTRTSMGARLLRRRMLRPSRDPAEIEARLDAVAEMIRSTIARGELNVLLGEVLDLERLLARITLGTAGPRELVALAKSLEQTPALRAHLAGCKSARLASLRDALDDIPPLHELLRSAISDEPPANLNEGGTVRDGYHPQLDELRDLSRNAKRYLADIETRERERTGIASLKVRFNNVFGYYIEISKANLANVPADYDRKQTLVNAERFITPELKELETKILEAEERMLVIEREVFEAVRKAVLAQAARVKGTAAAIAELDVHTGLATLATESAYCRPRFSPEGVMRIEGGRHPVIEQLMREDSQRFIPNDLYLDQEKQFLAIITGPNMGGKSTFLRQTALIALLAQMGSFVPANAALLPLVDRIFTRIGAADNLARGRSTFMVEMTETAAILNTASGDSLILLDEIGRGTATYDGLALAWGVAEFIQRRVGAKTLFATHYHELTVLADRLPGVVNLQVKVKEAGDKIIFLRRVEPGAADRSYGIEVARLAGLPQSLILRAREILKLHEKAESKVSEEIAPSPVKPSMQIQLFEPVTHGIAERIREVNLDELRPIEALQLLAELQRELNRQ